MRRFVPIIALCLMLVFLGSVCFAEVAKPAGKVVLTVTGDIAITNSDAGFEFDMEMLEGTRSS